MEMKDKVADSPEADKGSGVRTNTGISYLVSARESLVERERSEAPIIPTGRGRRRDRGSEGSIRLKTLPASD